MCVCILLHCIMHWLLWTGKLTNLLFYLFDKNAQLFLVSCMPFRLKIIFEVKSKTCRLNNLF